MERWPQFIKFRNDGRPSLMIEGRHYPEDSGPGAGCPPEHGLSRAEGIDFSTAQSVLKDADRDHIDVMVLYPSFGLCAPSLVDPEFAAGFARFYNGWIADYCKASRGRLRGVAVKTRLDHRIAMSMAVAQLFTEGAEVVLDDVGCVATSFPSFFTLLDGLCDPGGGAPDDQGRPA